MALESSTLLVIGQKGQLGFELMRALQPLGRVVGIDRSTCDLTDTAALDKLVLTVRPDVIVNAAAYTAVDKAEGDQDQAYLVNATSVKALAQSAATVGALLVHYSTDYVFDGSKATAYTEDDATSPVNVYGASKLAGEQAIAAELREHLIFRTTWVFGAHGGNFAKTMLKLAGARDSLNVIADQHGVPTSAALIADVSAHIIAQYFAARTAGTASATFPFGLYNLTAKGETTWHAYATKVIAEGIAAGLELKAAPERIHPIPTSDYPTPAKRPHNSRLSCDKLESTFGVRLPDWTVHVESTVKLLAELKQ
jgi:dTDP-4-dehydrorhamnose reductase